VAVAGIKDLGNSFGIAGLSAKPAKCAADMGHRACCLDVSVGILFNERLWG